ncbi:ribosomal protein S12 methylthiotransferase accessory factor [Actinacidiphila alni]|uniref:Ribosomal protein S12 methylthiotransferase accessory factor n=1 Tax=Actinacidiphila alni TaxID=380248 RepID=A0A1I2LWW1_9ACTN|nr:TOMM precursor leader peptide-binding protein [Actinacidiphila alni]SFF81481.1 ribosomal protein S12 methylthiotransferase accessory factor [Actinacidiphila alni]
MTENPLVPTVGFKRHFTSFVVDGEAVYLVSERGVCTVSGRLAELLAPLLDGSRTAEQIGAELSGTVPGDRVRGALDRLVDGGWVAATDPAADRSAAAFFEMAGLDGDTALAALAAATVRIETFGRVDAEPYAQALRAVGVRQVTVNQGSDAAADLVIALVDDYLHPGLEARNRQALADGVPWLIARPVGSIVWTGPVFVPDVFVPDGAVGESAEGTGCWQCLAHRLSANRQSLSYLQHRLGRDEPLSTAVAGLPATAATGTHLAVVEAAKWLAGARPEAAGVFTLDTVTLEAERHQLVRRPQCPACGDAELMARRQLEPVRFVPRPKVFTGDGGHRSTTPEEMLATYRPQLSPVTGVVTTLVPAENTPSGLRVYIAGQNLARQVGDLRQLRTGLRSVSCGKGRTDVQARASAMGEAMERYSGVHQGDEARRTASYEELGDAAVHPASSLLFSERQYAERDRWNARRSMFNTVPERFREDVPIEWSPAWSLTQQRTRWLPTMNLYYGYRHRSPFFAMGDSNGSAAGTSFEDAALQGFLELVERDAVALWWYNRVRRPAVDLDAFGDPYIDRMREVYAGLHREIWALDLTSDLGVPVVGAFSRRTDKPAEDVLIAFGAHLDPHIALTRALTEMNQFLAPVAGHGPEGTVTYAGADPEQKAWWTTATVANQPYLLPDRTAAPAGPGRWPSLAGDDLADDLALAQRLVEERGMEMLVLDHTRPDVGLPVAKVVVPGMRHFWARFAPGRLYDVPVELGWLDAPTAEADLNPTAIFI